MWKPMKKKTLFLLSVVLILPCFAGGPKGPVVEIDAMISFEQIKTMPWQVMGTCTENSQICVYMDTLQGDIVQLRRLDAKKFTVRDVDRPVSIDKLQEGAYLTTKFREKKLKQVTKTVLTVTYEEKRGK